MTPDVLMLSDTRPSALARLKAGYALHPAQGAAAREAAVSQVGATCRAIVASGHVPIDAALLDRLPALEIISCGSAGFEAFDTRAIARRGIHLTNASPALAQEVADMAMLLAQAAWRNLVAADAWVRDGDWARQGEFPLQRGFRGRRLGVVGMGTIGQEIARLAELLGLEVAGWNRSPRALPWPMVEDLTELAQGSDIVIVAVAGGAGTQALISDQVLRAIGPQGLFVNVARGSVVDEPAMIAALQDGGLGAAALDVFATEPDPDPRLTALPNVTLSPHQGSGTVETRDAMAGLMVDNLDAHFAGRPLISPVVLERG